MTLRPPFKAEARVHEVVGMGRVARELVGLAGPWSTQPPVWAVMVAVVEPALNR